MNSPVPFQLPPVIHLDTSSDKGLASSSQRSITDSFPNSKINPTVESTELEVLQFIKEEEEETELPNDVLIVALDGIVPDFSCTDQEIQERNEEEEELVSGNSHSSEQVVLAVSTESDPVNQIEVTEQEQPRIVGDKKMASSESDTESDGYEASAKSISSPKRTRSQSKHELKDDLDDDNSNTKQKVTKKKIGPRSRTRNNHNENASVKKRKTRYNRLSSAESETNAGVSDNSKDRTDQSSKSPSPTKKKRRKKRKKRYTLTPEDLKMEITVNMNIRIDSDQERRTPPSRSSSRIRHGSGLSNSSERKDETLNNDEGTRSKSHSPRKVTFLDSRPKHHRRLERESSSSPEVEEEEDSRSKSKSPNNKPNPTLFEICKFCNEVFANQAALKRHILISHTKEEPRSSRSRSNNNALNNTSSTSSSTSCDICMKTFKSVATLNRHIVVEHKKKSDTSERSEVSQQANNHQHRICVKLPESETSEVCVRIHPDHLKLLQVPLTRRPNEPSTSKTNHQDSGSISKSNRNSDKEELNKKIEMWEVRRDLYRKLLNDKCQINLFDIGTLTKAIRNEEGQINVHEYYAKFKKVEEETESKREQKGRKRPVFINPSGKEKAKKRRINQDNNGPAPASVKRQRRNKTEDSQKDKPDSELESPVPETKSDQVQIKEPIVYLENIGHMPRLCPICDNEVPIKDLSIHKASHTIACDYCKDEIPILEVAQHGASHMMTSLICHICQYKAPNKVNLWGHINGHNNLNPLICIHCGNSFATTSNLRCHIASKHTSLKIEYECEYCDEKFKSFRAKRLHEFTHSGLKCTYCNKTFDGKKVVDAHIKQQHYVKLSSGKYVLK